MAESSRIVSRGRRRRLSFAPRLEPLERRDLLTASYLEGQIVGNIESSALTELSGMVASRSHDGVLWGHNDSGDSARVFAMDASGQHLGTYAISAATATDWEDIAIGPGPVSDVDYLYMADTGDNAQSRNSIVVYRVPEPSVDPDQSPVTTTLGGTASIRLVYPDGPKDAETLLVDPLNGDIYLITKRDSLSRIYRAAYPQSTEGTNTLDFMAQMTISGAVGGDISPTGDEVLVKDYDTIWHFERAAGANLWDVLQGQPSAVPYVVEPKGESVTFDDNGYFTSSEGSHQPIFYYARAGADAPRTVTFQQGAGDYSGTQDTFLQHNSPTANNAGDTSLNVDSDDPAGSGRDTQALLQMGGLFGEGTSQIPPGASIESARLTLRVTNNGDPVHVHRMLSSWTEDSTWNSLSAGIQTDNLEAEATAVFQTSKVSTGPLVLDVTESVLAWQADPSTNHGWAFLPTGSNGIDFYSSETSNISNRPSLSVTYRLPTSATPVPLDDSYSATEDVNLEIAAPGVLANDTDEEDDPLTVELVAPPSDGSLTLAPDGSFVYTPPANFNGQVTFTYRTSDGTTSSPEATVVIDVAAANDAPAAADDTLALDEDAILTIPAPGILQNDTDADGDALTPVVVSGPTSGELTLLPDGGLTYTPAADFAGVDSFSYRATDGSFDSNVATVTITVAPVNDAPTAADGLLTTVEDLAASGLLSGVDIDSSDLTYEIVGAAALGTVTVTDPATGAYVYTPNPDVHGEDSFTFTVSDGEAVSNTATVRITIVAENDLPLATNDFYTTTASTTLTVLAPGVLDNDSDVDADPLSAVIASGPAHGTVELFSDGSFVYTPVTGFVGEDSFTYHASDGVSSSDTATVTIRVDRVNAVPVADDGTLAAHEDEPASGLLAASDLDGDPLSYNVVSQPSLGTVVIIDAATGEYLYTPHADAHGTDSFAFRVSDGLAESNVATVEVDITPVNDAPLASDSDLAVSEDLASVGILPATDVDGDALVYSIIEPPAQGTLVVDDATGAYTYTPHADAHGSDSFSFRANDGAVDSNIASVRVTIAPVNDLPVANDGMLATVEDTPFAGTLAASDLDGDPLSYDIMSQPSRGTVVITDAATGEYLYTPHANAHGTDSFTFRVSDGLAESNVATIEVDITPVNDAPLASDSELAVSEDLASLGVLPATDVDGDALVYSIIEPPAQGTLVVDDATGEYTYTPHADAHGSDSFSFRTNDGAVDSNIASVRVTIAPVNDLPVANDGMLATVEDTPFAGTLAASDLDGDPLSYDIVSQPGLGTVVIVDVATGEYIYTPQANAHGTDSFTFRVSDGLSESNVATIGVTIDAVNDVPLANEDAYTVRQGEELIVDAGAGVLANDLDIEGELLTGELMEGPANGTLDFHADGSFAYVPQAGFAGSDTFTYRASDGTSVGGAVTVTIDVRPTALLYFALSSSAQLGDADIDNEDIVAFDGANFGLYFDGSDVGIASRTISAFSILNETELLLSFTSSGSIPGISQRVDDSDIVKFTATSLGADTAGTFSLFFDGSDVGLSRSGEDIDALGLLDDGRLVISTTGSISVPGESGRDEDLLVFSPERLGTSTDGRWEMYFDGSDVGLSSSSENIDGVAVDALGDVYISTTGSYSVSGASGSDEDVLIFTPSSLGNSTKGKFRSARYFDGSRYGLSGNDVVAMEVPAVTVAAAASAGPVMAAAAAPPVAEVTRSAEIAELDSTTVRQADAGRGGVDFVPLSPVTWSVNRNLGGRVGVTSRAADIWMQRLGDRNQRTDERALDELFSDDDLLSFALEIVQGMQK